MGYSGIYPPVIKPNNGTYPIWLDKLPIKKPIYWGYSIAMCDYLPEGIRDRLTYMSNYICTVCLQRHFLSLHSRCDTLKLYRVGLDIHAWGANHQYCLF